jgi:glycosyltransferase involved in cell wall biosynthesis
MKIVNIIPGFGGSFYCGNCLRDSVFVKTLKTMGHDSVMLPIYLPLSYDNHQPAAEIPVFYGAVNIYLKQNFKILRHMPGWLHRFFDSKPILKYAAQKAGSTRATGLEEMTMSMLQGSEGFQREELQQLIDYLKHHEKPDIVHLSNSLLLGLASKIKEELRIPVVCSLQDEDVWVDAMSPSFQQKLWDLMTQKGQDVDAFIGVSEYFGRLMKEKLSIPDQKLHIIPIGVNPANYTVVKPSLNPPTIGYLSRMCEENGFAIVVDAFIELKDKSIHKNTRLKLTGGYTGDDKPLMNKQLKKLRRKGYLNDVEFIENFRTESLPAFFNGLTAVSVPVLKGEAFGLYQLEALASGIPVVQPALGAFPEIANATGGGITYTPNTASALADAFAELFSKPEKLQQLSINGRNAVIEKYNTKALTEKMITVYSTLIH